MLLFFMLSPFTWVCWKVARVGMPTWKGFPGFSFGLGSSWSATYNPSYILWRKTKMLSSTIFAYIWWGVVFSEKVVLAENWREFSECLAQLLPSTISSSFLFQTRPHWSYILVSGQQWPPPIDCNFWSLHFPLFPLHRHIQTTNRFTLWLATSHSRAFLSFSFQSPQMESLF